jgi:hypothetical protein
VALLSASQSLIGAALSVLPFVAPGNSPRLLSNRRRLPSLGKLGQLFAACDAGSATIVKGELDEQFHAFQQSCSEVLIGIAR